MAEHDTERDEADAEVRVNDRRLFTAEGDLRGEVVDDEPAAPVESPEAGPGFEHRPVEEPVGVDFTMLINAMAEPALLFLGEIAHPSTGQPTVDLERAKIQIDMLDLLRVKCRGNLSTDEEGLLDRILYQLRMLYVARAKQPEEK